MVGNREIDSFNRNEDAKKIINLTNQTQTIFHVSIILSHIRPIKY